MKNLTEQQYQQRLKGNPNQPRLWWCWARPDCGCENCRKRRRRIRIALCPGASRGGRALRTCERTQKAHFPKRTSDDTESQAMVRIAVVEFPDATAATPPAMALCGEVAGRLQARVKQSTQAINRLHKLLARLSRAGHFCGRCRRRLGFAFVSGRRRPPRTRSSKAIRSACP